jgi:5-formyltetrahydrofolate cyclo-ligase
MIFWSLRGHEINPIDHEIIIIPTVGVDKNGIRLGYGGGYYDRLFGDLLLKSRLRKPLLVGLLIYDFQKIDNDAIGDEVHDMKLDHSLF